MLVPDHVQKGVWDADVDPNLAPGAALLFAHGLNSTSAGSCRPTITT